MKYKLLKKFGTSEIGTILEMEEADAKSLLDSGMVELVSEVEDEAQKAVKLALDGLRDGIKGLISEELATALKGIKLGGPNVEVGKNREEDDPNHLTKNLGTFAKAVKAYNGGAGMSKELDAYVKAASGMNEAVGEEGGILIPDQLSAGIWERAQNVSDILGRVQNIPVTGNTYTILQESGDTRGVGVRNAGVRGYWVEEAGKITSSKPTFRRKAMRLKKLAVLCYVTDEQLEDSPQSLEAYLSGKAGQEIAFMVGDSLMNGDGIGKPLGVLNADCLISVTAETDQAADSILTENIVKMEARLHPPSLNNAGWYINQNTKPQLSSLFLAAGLGGIPMMWPVGGMGQKLQNTILGMAVTPTEWNPGLGDAGDILLADWSQYMTITKGGVKTAMSIHLRFDYDETAFRFTYRIDGLPVWPTVLTPYKGTADTQSPFIVIAARE